MEKVRTLIRSPYLLLLLSLAIGACSAHNDTDGATQASSQSMQQKKSVEVSSVSSLTVISAQNKGLSGKTISSPPGSNIPAGLLTGIHKNIQYYKFRHQLLANGWQPVSTPSCMANVVGGNYKSLCTEHPELQSCHLCDQLPELNTCSGDGYCLVKFQHTGTSQIIQITTYGDVPHWNDPDSGLTVTHWKFYTPIKSKR